MKNKTLIISIISALFIVSIILLAPQFLNKSGSPPSINIKNPSSLTIENHPPINQMNPPIFVENKSDKQDFLEKQNNPKQIDISNLPRFVDNNFIELDKISKISKFRSGAGHDFSKGVDETESCRSMKHYFEPIGIDDAFWSKFHNGNVSKSDWPIIKYFSPVSGTIVDVRSAENMFGDKENQFIIESEKYPNIWFNFFHIITNKTLHVGSNVKAGEFLGTISPGSSGEIVVSVNSDFDEQLVSFFDVIDDKVFLEYKGRGVKSRDEFIISKSERDENLLICDVKEPHRFLGSKNIPDNERRYSDWSMSSDNWVFLN